MENKEKILAINGGIPYKKNKFPEWPVRGKREMELLAEVVESGCWWRMNGTKVEKFEKLFADMHNCNYCLGVTSGTIALELSLLALGIKEGDEVIVPAFTYISTASAVVYCNAKPVLVDVNPETFCLDENKIEEAITEKTKVIIPVHMAGHACNMETICNIAQKHNLHIIEDCAHGHNGEYNGKKLGSFGDVSIFSFQNGKLMTCGEGGAILTNNRLLYDKLFLMHSVGRPKIDDGYTHRVIGTTCRMNEFQAAVLIAQIERVSELMIKRIENSKYLDKLLLSIDGITAQKCSDYAVNGMTHYMYMFYYDSTKFGDRSRKEFVQALNAEGIPANISFPVVSKTELFLNSNFLNKISKYNYDNEKKLDNATKIGDNVVCLPHYTLLGTKEDIEDIFYSIKKIKESFVFEKGNVDDE